MKTRDGIIDYQKTLDDAGTLTKDISLRDPVSAFYLEFEATNETTSNKGNYISDIITKVEIVDGSEVLYSLNMFQLEALHFYKTGKTPVMFPSEWASGQQRHGVYLLFGKHLYDMDYAMDFTKFDNPQLKITTNIAAIRAVGSNIGFATGTIKGTIVAKIMEDITPPAKYLMAKQVENFTSETSGEKRINMPRDYPYRLLLGRFYVQQSDINEVITDLKLTCDTDAFIAFNRKVQQLDAEALAQFGRVALKHDIFTHHQSAFREVNNKENSSNFSMWEDTTGYMVGTQYEWSSEGKLDVIKNDGTTLSSDAKITGKENGHAMHATLPIPFGLMNTPSTWFNPKPYTKVELVATQAVAAVCEIALEQERNL